MVAQSELHLLPSLHLARLFSEQPDGKKVYYTTTGKLVCPHGETAHSIYHFIGEEKKADADGQPRRPRGGCHFFTTCDCQSTEGLNVKVPDDIPPPTPPSSLFEYLEERDTELITVKGRPARRIPHLPGPMYVTSVGRLCCRHGASRRSLLKRQNSDKPSVRLPTCGCELRPLSLRTGLKGLRLGKYAGKAVLAPTTNSGA